MPSDLDPDQEWQKFCTQFFPGYLAQQLQQLSTNDRSSLHTDVAALERFEKEVVAQAMAAAREEVQKVQLVVRQLEVA
jgi:hypothetical protein